MGEALRYNEGKLRYDLLEPFAQQEVARVFTIGAEKYAPRNWEKGMAWSKVVASLKRHIAAFEKGEDMDDETGCYHMAHAAWNALALVSYYKLAPHFDDRTHSYLSHRKIGLDIDEVICNWLPDWCNYWNIKIPSTWFFDKDIMNKFDILRNEGKLDGFYLNLKPLTLPDDIPFEPHCYVTSRPVSTEITEQWLSKWGFPARPVITVPVGGSKLQALKDAGVEIFVDDRMDNFVELNNGGICTYLFDAPHNQRYEVGFKRIKNLKELL
jgi:uncharacterized HAD superfamily protein